jgi:hypothetical protein
LLDKGADPDPKCSRHNKPLLCAARNGNTEVVVALLEKGALLDLSGSYFSPLEVAKEKKHETIINIFNEHIKKYTMKIDASAQEAIANYDLTQSDNIHPLIKSLNECTAIIHKDFAKLFKETRQTTRTTIVTLLTNKVNTLLQDDKAASFSALKNAKENLSIIIKEFNLLQRRPRTTIEEFNPITLKKTARKEMEMLQQRVEDKLNALVKTQAVIAHQPLKANIMRIANDNMTQETLAKIIKNNLIDPMNDEEIKLLREMIASLSQKERINIKQRLMAFVISLADHYKGSNQKYAWLINRLHEEHTYGESIPLFELFKMGNNSKINYATDTWKKFCAIMKEGNFLKEKPENQASVSQQGTFAAPNTSDEKKPSLPYAKRRKNPA